MKLFLPTAIVLLCVSPLSAADVFLGSGAKAGEITDETAIVHVRLTSTPGI